MNATRQVQAWLSHGDPTRFPYEAVVDAYHEDGKHAVDQHLLQALSAVGRHLNGDAGAATQRLATFLHCALDMHEHRFHYGTYLGLPLLPLPPFGDPSLSAESALQRRDRLLVLLINDLMDFELNAAGGTTDLLPRQRPAVPVVVKRLRLALRVISPALTRLRLLELSPADHPEVQAQQVRRAVAGALTDVEHLQLRLSMLPVDTLHDEYLFLRVLQAYETMFALLAVDLQAVVYALQEGTGYSAVHRLTAATTAFTEGGLLFSLVATMNPAVFHTFRVHTDGASAIQSEHYKLVESLCRTPDPDRLDSAAYRSTPHVRDRIHAGQATIAEAYQGAAANGLITAKVAGLVEAAMQDLAAAIDRWRLTHHRIAVRFLGAEQAGTGATEGTGYLLRARDAAVFNTVQTGPQSATNQ